MPFRSALGHPLLWLVVQPAALMAILTAAGGMAVQTQPDTQGYWEADLSSWRAAAAQTRTLGYPLLLRAAANLGPSLAAVPYLQFALHAAAVAALFAGLRRYGFAPSAALAAASVLFYSRFFLEYVAVALPDAPSLSCAVVAVACIAAAAARSGAIAWIGLTLAIAAAYHLRPAYLFLLPLAPLLGLALAWLKREPEARTPWLPLAVGLTAAAAGPFFLYCGLRAATVGHFGLVSFGGYNVIGISGQWLTPEAARELPAHLQPLAEVMLRRRAEAPDERPPAGYFEMYENFNPTVWQVAAPAAAELYGDDDVQANARLADLAKRLIWLKPAAYLRWLKPAAKHGLTQLFEYSFLDRIGLALLAGLALTQAILVSRWRRGAASLGRAGGGRYFFELHAMLLMALALALAKLLLVVLVEPPIHRYVAPAAVLLPSWLAIVLLDRLDRVLGRTSPASALQ